MGQFILKREHNKFAAVLLVSCNSDLKIIIIFFNSPQTKLFPSPPAPAIKPSTHFLLSMTRSSHRVGSKTEQTVKKKKKEEEEKVAVRPHDCVREEAAKLLESEGRQREVGKVEVVMGRVRLCCWSQRMWESRGGGGRSVGESRDSSSHAASLISTDLTFENLPPPPPHPSLPPSPLPPLPAH